MIQVFLWARAPGYAWGRILVDLQDPREWTLRLERSAELSLWIQGAPPPRGLVLRIRPARDGEEFARRIRDRYESIEESQLPEGKSREELIRAAEEHFRAPSSDLEISLAHPPVFECKPTSPGPTVVSGLACRRYAVAAEVGSLHRPVRLASAWADLRSGSSVAVTLTLSSLPPTPAGVTVSGTLHVPGEWGPPESPIQLDFLGDGPGVKADLRPVVDAPSGTYGFQFSEVRPGHHQLTLAAYSWRKVITVDERPSLLSIRIPAPSSVTVRVIDQQTDEPIELNQLGWYCDAGTERRHGGGASVPRSEETGVFRFRAPQGPVTLEVSDEKGTYANLREQVEVRPGANEFVLRVARWCGVLVIVEHEGRRIPWEWDRHEFRARRRDGPGRIEGYLPSLDGSLRLLLSQPGRYEISASGYEGLQALEPLAVELEAGEFVEWRIELQR